MKLIGMMPVRNEAWCLGLSLRVALLWCDEVVVLLHACADDSARIVYEIARENPGRLAIITHRHETWTEMAHRQQMLEAARGLGATHLAIIDADEILTANLLQWTEGERRPIGQALHDLPAGSILELPGYNIRDPHSVNQDIHTSPGLWFHSNGVWGHRWFSTAYADDLRLGWWGDKFHSRTPNAIHSGAQFLRPYRPIEQGKGGVLHLWGASERRLIAKHALYKITEHLRGMHDDAWIDREYSLSVKGDPRIATYGTPATWTYAPIAQSWWAPYADLMKYLDVDAEPWQEAEVRRLVAVHGRGEFESLDLFGVA
jgi:hypothetical protein